MNIQMDLQATIEKAVSDAIGKHKYQIQPQREFDLTDICGASEITGYSRNTIYKLTSTNQIPFIKRPGGRKLFFSKKALERWLLSEK